MIVCRIAVTSYHAHKVTQEPLLTFPLPTQSEVEYRPSARPTVLPEVQALTFYATITTQRMIHRRNSK
jgi:hypothetical protein